MTIAKEVRRTVAKTKTLQKRLVECQKGIQKNIKQLEETIKPYVQNRLADMFPGVQFWISSSCFCGSSTTDWKPAIHIRVVAGEYWQGKWYGYHGPIEPPLSAHKLRKFLKQLGSEVGLPCLFAATEPTWVMQNKIRSKKNPKMFSYPSPYEPGVNIAHEG